MKALLRSFVVLALVLATTGTATLAYFTSNVSATGNLITTGTLRLAVDATGPGTGDSYWVAYDDGSGVTRLNAPFPEVSNMQPGETRDVYVGVRNYGTLPLDYRAYVTGTWGDDDLDVQNVVSVTNVRRFGTACVDPQCVDLQGYYSSNGYTHIGPSPFTDFGGPITGYFGYNQTTGDAAFRLAPMEAQIFRVSVTLDEDAGNDFQGQTFTYTLNVEGKQTTAPTF
jgi:predicted ribosomally synthesized peptide with SipW-like signal peptide